MFALGCLKFIKHSLQNSRQLLDEMKPSRLFWFQMICCCNTVKASGTQGEMVLLVTPWDILSQAMGDCGLIPGFLASNGEFGAKAVPCSSPRVLEHGRTRGEVGLHHMCHTELCWCRQDTTSSLEEMHRQHTARRNTERNPAKGVFMLCGTIIIYNNKYISVIEAFPL